MPPQHTDVRSFQQQTPWQLLLHTETELHRTRDYKIRIDGVDVENGITARSGAARGVRKVSVGESNGLQERRKTRLSEGDVTLGLVVEDAKTATNRRLAARKRCVGESNAGSKQRFGIEQPARRRGRDGLN
jgi:hypothetical protein